MKLIQAEFKNFRLLRNLKLTFSTDDEKKLTVIRAENETGKTTILVGLQWALYGDSALPNSGKNYRLHPINWIQSNGEAIPISVEVEFEVKKYRNSMQGPIETIHVYRITRTAYESLNEGDWQRMSSNVTLYERTETGDKLVDNPTSTINDVLPLELRNVFFTDGDQALSFVEASASTKRYQVQKAIRSLLGLEVIESALKHVQKTASIINKEVQNISSDAELVKTTTSLDTIQNEEIKIVEELEDTSMQYLNFNEALKNIKEEIDEILVKGDREKLKNDISEIREQIKEIDNQSDQAAKEHLNLFRSLEFSRELLIPVLEQGLKVLDELRDQGKIQMQTFRFFKKD